MECEKMVFSLDELQRKTVAKLAKKATSGVHVEVDGKLGTWFKSSGSYVSPTIWIDQSNNPRVAFPVPSQTRIYRGVGSDYPEMKVGMVIYELPGTNYWTLKDEWDQMQRVVDQMDANVPDPTRFVKFDIDNMYSRQICYIPYCGTGEGLPEHLEVVDLLMTRLVVKVERDIAVPLGGLHKGQDRSMPHARRNFVRGILEGAEEGFYSFVGGAWRKMKLIALDHQGWRFAGLLYRGHGPLRGQCDSLADYQLEEVGPSPYTCVYKLEPGETLV